MNIAMIVTSTVMLLLEFSSIHCFDDGNAISVAGVRTLSSDLEGVSKLIDSTHFCSVGYLLCILEENHSIAFHEESITRLPLGVRLVE